MKREQLRRRLEKQMARDNTQMRQWTRSRAERIERALKMPILPRLCSICTLAMMFGSIAAATADPIAYYRRTGDFPNKRVIYDAALSGLVIWLLFGTAVVYCCIAQIRRGFEDPWYESRKLDRKGRKRLPPRKYYLRRLNIALIGAVIWFVLTALASKALHE